MELKTTLQSQTVQNRIREVGINPNHWYPVRWAEQLKVGTVHQVTIWYQNIAIYRDHEGNVHALADACPHKGVALHKGEVKENRLVCPYHGWEFNSQGECVKIPYFSDEQKLPRACARSYPIQEKYDLIWVFPGDPKLANEQPILQIPEFENRQWLRVPVTAHFNAHFSMCNENTIDVFHGYLHQNLQGWFNPELINLKETEHSVCAQYNVSYQGVMAKFLGLTDRADEVTTLPITIEYRYPHYATNLEGISSLYLMRLPVSKTESRSFAYFFFNLGLPQWLLNLIRPLLVWGLQRFVLHRFLAQDIEMVESEQETYLKNPQRQCVEVNPAIFAIQRLILKQSDQSNGQQSSQ
ncbi:MAG: Rieske 2Fe-2S domain-containing protein [Cyanobacteria bacterium]|jgi:phenylpropionate dioxygenase-like ring-hydroxylating dioxygenase large terminal subunit|nr:Rieske 2Fe-2S domain-containing protein [Cyanobacteria bacterium GSL.Bin1]